MRRPAHAGLLALLLLLAAASSAHAILYIDINAPGGKRMPVAVPDLVVTEGDPEPGRSIPRIIAGDLKMTALFDVIPRDAYLEKITPSHFAGKPLSFPDWKLIGAEAVVIGEVAARGGDVSVEMRLYDATLGTMMAGKRYTAPLRRIRTVAHRFANEILYAFTGVRGIFDTDIVFTARAEGSRGKEVYVVGLDGGDLRKITGNRSFNLFPRWSPDGASIAYTSFRTGRPVIYLRRLSDGSERPVVTFGNAKTPGCFSPDGASLYASVSVKGNSDIYRIRLDGSAVEKVAGGWGLEVSPSVSPDGKRIAFVSDRSGSPQVYVKEIGGPEAQRISHAGFYSTSPSWSPVEDRIAFTSLANGKYAIYTVRPDGSDQRLVVSADGDCVDPSFSPDGRYLVYTYQKKGYSELRVASADGRWGRVLVSGRPGAGSPSWSPRR
ncbi:MAG: hypothetical protein M1550_00390 [Deltaproteobacteria bacterium]|nr:hypothetical protein [Deltaproteobacteria bacterium]